MKFGIAFANIGPFVAPDAAAAFAKAAEANGFESLWTVEHVVVPAGYESTYPYSPDGKMPGPRGFADPRPADLAGLRRCGDRAHPPGHRRADPAAAQPRGPRQGAGHSRPPVAWAGHLRASASAGSPRSSPPSACRSPSGRRAPRSTSPPCAPCGATIRRTTVPSRRVHRLHRPPAARRRFDPDPRRRSQRGGGTSRRSTRRRLPPGFARVVRRGRRPLRSGPLDGRSGRP